MKLMAERELCSVQINDIGTLFMVALLWKIDLDKEKEMLL